MSITTSSDNKKTICPVGCTQRRTMDNRLAEKKTFNGIKCYNCGFEIKYDKSHTYQKYSLYGKTNNFKIVQF